VAAIVRDYTDENTAYMAVGCAPRGFDCMGDQCHGAHCCRSTFSNRVEALAKVTPENCQVPRHLNSPTTTGVFSCRSTCSLFFNTAFCARFPVHTPVEPVSHCHSHSHEFDRCSGLQSLAVMVKVTENWLTVEDGTKLYTKTWEVGRSHLLSLWL
jgi:hypothetical protein